MIRALLFIIGLIALSLGGPSQAQNVNLNCWNPNATSGLNQWLPCNATTPLQIAGSISASIGGFTPSASGARGTPLVVTTSDSSGNLPTGTVVVVSNVGANPMYCNVNGVAATTSDQFISSSGGWFAFTIPAAVTTLHCIATGGSTTSNTVGGSGLATGTGGGGGGGGGGGLSVTDQAAWTQASSSFTPNGGVFNDSSTLSSGQQGTQRYTTKRAGIVDVDTTGNALYTAITSAAPCLNATTATTNTYTTGQTNPSNCDINGNLYVRNTPTTTALTNGVTAAMTGTTSTSLLGVPAGSLRNYLTHLICTNSHATVGTFIIVQDGSGGTTIYEGYAAAVGGGFSMTLPVPLKQPTTATALFVQDVTTGANVICAGSGFQAL